MLVRPPSIDKYRLPLAVRFLVPVADQENKSVGDRLLDPVFTNDPVPSTSSISCWSARSASKLMLATGRVNENEFAEFRVTMPSKGAPVAILPFAVSAGGVFSPTARPFALVGWMLVDNALVGRVPLAIPS